MVERRGGASAGAGLKTGGRGFRAPILVHTLATAGRVREAIEVGETSLNRGDAGREECEALAQAYWLLGMGRSAERLALTLSRQHPPSIDALVLLGEIYSRRMWASQLQSLVRRLATEAPWHPALRELTRALETVGHAESPPSGTDVDSVVAQADWSLRRGWVTKAESLLHRALQARPGHPRAEDLLWACRRERQLDNRPAAAAAASDAWSLFREEVTAPTITGATSPVSSPGVSSPGVAGPMGAAPAAAAVETIEASEAVDDDEDEDLTSSGTDDDDDTDDDYDDDEDEVTEDVVSVTGRVSFSVRDRVPRPSPLQNQVVVIERGDSPRLMTDHEHTEKKGGLWFRGSRDLSPDELGQGENITLPGEIHTVTAALSPVVRPEPAERSRPPATPVAPTPDSRGVFADALATTDPMGIRPAGGGTVPSWSFEDDEKATQVVEKSAVEARSQVISLLHPQGRPLAAEAMEISSPDAAAVPPGGVKWHDFNPPSDEGPTTDSIMQIKKPITAPPVPPQEWEESRTRVADPVSLMDAGLPTDEATRTVGAGATRVQSDPRIQQPETTAVLGEARQEWERDILTRVGGLDQMDQAAQNQPAAHPPANVAASQPPPVVPRSQEVTRPMPVGMAPRMMEQLAAPTIPGEPVPQRVATPWKSAPRNREAPLKVPKGVSSWASPLLWGGIALILVVVALVFFGREAAWHARMDDLAQRVEAWTLKADLYSFQAASDAVEEERASRPGELTLEALQARVAWAKWVEIGGSAVVPPDAEALDTLKITLANQRDLLISRAYHDLFTGDVIRGAIRLQEAQAEHPGDLLLGCLLARLQLLSDLPSDRAEAQQTINEVVRLAEQEAPALADNGIDVTPFIKSQVFYTAALVAQSRGEISIALAFLARAEELNRSYPWLGVMRASLSISPDADITTTIAALDRALQIQSVKMPARQKAWLMVNQADRLIAAGQIPAALGYLDRALTADPNWPEVLWRSAQSQIWRGDHPLALERLAQAASLAPFDVKIAEDRAVLLLDSGQWLEAERVLGRLPETLQSALPILRAHVEIALARGNLAEAETRLAKALARAPDDARVRLLQARVHILKGQSDEARALLEGLLKNGQGLQAGLSEARLLARLVQVSRSSTQRKLIRDATTAAPRDPVVRELIADAKMAAGDMDEAARYLDDAIKIAPERVHTRLLLARYAAQQGDLNAARTHWEVVKANCGDFPLCEEVRRAVESTP